MPLTVEVDQYEGLGESFSSKDAKGKELEGFYIFLIVKNKQAKSIPKTLLCNQKKQHKQLVTFLRLFTCNSNKKLHKILKFMQQGKALLIKKLHAPFDS